MYFYQSNSFRHKRIVLLAFFASLFSIGSNGQEIVTNGSFENGLSGWNVFGSWQSTFGVSLGVPAADGDYFAQSMAGNHGSLSEVIPTVPGQAYRFGASAGANRGVLDLYWNGGLAGHVDVTLADGNFYRSEFEVIATGTATEIRLQPPALPDPQWFGIDSVSVIPIPEPSALWIILAAASCFLPFHVVKSFDMRKVQVAGITE